MRNKFLYFFVLFAVLKTFTSCEKDIELDFNKPAKLCLNCVLNPDSTVSARLTLSRDIENKNTFESVKGAKILLYENGQELDTFTFAGNGNYYLNYHPIFLNKYEITVSHPDFQTISATTAVPQRPLVSHNSDTLEYSEQGHYYSIDVNFSIHDLPGNNSYWLYSKATLNGSTHTGGGFQDINAPFIDDFNREIETEAKYGFVYNYYVRISDEGYDGKALTFNTTRITGSYMNFVSADEHYNKYIKSSVKARLNSEGDLPFREPVQIYSNIKNGHGIFGACAITSIKL